MSERYLCLNCWRAPAREETFFRCDACAGVERPEWMQQTTGSRRRVGEVRRPWWAALFSDDPGKGPCPKHPDAAVQLFCECGYPLSERAAFRHGAPLGLGIAGPRSSGKTLLTITMMHEIHRCLEVEGKKVGLMGLDDTEQRFHQLSASLFDHGDKPIASQSEEPAASWEEHLGVPSGNFSWAISVEVARRRAQPAMLLAVYDLGGETWGLPRHVRHRHFDRYLGHLGSLVFLIDGMSLAADLGYEVEDAWDHTPPPGDRGAAARQWFSRIEERLGGGARKVDLALVISKADGLWDRDEWTALQPGSPETSDERRAALVEDLLLRARRRDVLIAARQKFRKVGLFSVSSLGFCPAPTDVNGGGHLKRSIAPKGVTEPLVWLLKQRLVSLR